MKEIIKEVISKIGFTETLKAIIDKGFEKVAVSAVAATIWDIGTIFAVFVFLAIVDIFTRLVACAYHLWEKSYGVEFTKQQGGIDYAEQKMQEFSHLCLQFIDQHVKDKAISDALTAYVDYVVMRNY